MWVSKWILASLFTDENVIAEGIESVLHRTGKGAMSDVDSAFNVEISPAAPCVKIYMPLAQDRSGSWFSCSYVLRLFWSFI